MPTESTVDYLYGDQIPSDAVSSDLADLLADNPVILAAPSPSTNSTVNSSDLLTFVGSGAHDFVAYRTGDYTSYCIYPVRISSDGLVTGTDCDTIEIYNRSGSRTISYGTDDISLQLTGSSYVYSDQTGPYITLWNAAAARSPLDYLSTYLLIAFCCLSIFGTLVRRCFR